MKKLLLSSIIMLGACGIASAQTDSKLAPKSATTSAAAATPQISTADGSTANAIPATAPVVVTDANAAAKPARVSKNTTGNPDAASDVKQRDAKMAASETKIVKKKVQN